MGCSPRASNCGAREIELLASTRDRDVGKASFFREFLGLTQRTLVREGSILHAGHEDDREFQALRGVNRHEGHLTASTFFLGKLVGVCD